MKTTLEARVTTLERMAEEQRENLNGKILSDGKMLTAIGETQSKHGQQLNVIEGKIDNLDRGQRKLGRDVEALQADMGMVKGRLTKVEGKLDKLDEKVDRGLGELNEKLDLLLNR